MRRLSVALGLALGIVVLALMQPRTVGTPAGTIFAITAGLGAMGLVVWAFYSSPARALGSETVRAQKSCQQAIRSLRDARHIHERAVMLGYTLNATPRTRLERSWEETRAAINAAYDSYNDMEKTFIRGRQGDDPREWLRRMIVTYGNVEQLALSARTQLDNFESLCDELEATSPERTEPL